MQGVMGKSSRFAASMRPVLGRRGPASDLTWLLAGAVFALVGAGQPTEAGDVAPSISAPSTIVTASPDVSVGNRPVARQGDQTSTGAAIVTGSPNVFINGKPAVTSGAPTSCNGIVVGTSASVFVNGKPLAGQGDPVTGCPAR
ncbi:MAG: PAAR domain-containing protein [Ancalomicrobiaceae bacterium]|nr:PAAR domain-containing protein [Ancalomicrobiaceae bacterium]